MSKKPKYKIEHSVGNVKKGMIFEWNEEENCYTTKSLPWFLTPLIEKEEMKERIKFKQFKEITKTITKFFRGMT